MNPVEAGLEGLGVIEWTFERYAVLGHARIGLQHVFKIRYVGTPTMTLHHRLGPVDGRWLVLESERV